MTGLRIVGVIDLRQGRAVYARGGHRDGYRDVQAAAGVRVDGDPLALARAYTGAGVDGIYVADLDAIDGGSLQAGVLARLAAEDVPILLDAGVSSLSAAVEAGRIAERVVVGLETLSSWSALEQIAAGMGRARTAFSLDLRGGMPLGRFAAGDAGPAIAAQAVAAGAGSVLVIDVAQVGMSCGPDIASLRSIRTAVPGVPLLAGGGVRNDDDLARLAACGCNGALVATALHEGRLSRQERRT